MLRNENKHTEKTLERFAKYVIQQSRSILTKKKINASKGIYDSLDYDLTVSKNSFNLSLEVADYWKFIDYGVKGTEGGTSRAGYRYTNKKPPARVFKEWARVKPIKPRDLKTGRFITNEAFSFIMQNHIFKQGIKPTGFLTTPFERAFKSLPAEVVKAYGLDLEDFIKFTIEKK